MEITQHHSTDKMQSVTAKKVENLCEVSVGHQIGTHKSGVKPHDLNGKVRSMGFLFFSQK